MQIAAMLVSLAMLQTGGHLEIKDVKVGSGTTAKLGDRVTVDYTGKLTSGKQFDSSVGRAPFSFVIGAGEVIKGWDQGVPGMKVGGKRDLTIPSTLGYGAAGAGEDIPPNSTLKFNIELKKVESVKVQILKPGTGEPLTGPKKISIHYVGMFTNGKKFDASRDHGGPMDMVLGQQGVIPGFTMAVVGMKLGEKRKVTIPPSLGYGANANGPIPANSTLVFELELVKVSG